MMSEHKIILKVITRIVANRDDMRNSVPKTHRVLRYAFYSTQPDLSVRSCRMKGTLLNMSEQRITPEEIETIARLARLDLSPSALDESREDLLDILKHVKALQTIDTNDVEPMARPHNAVNRLDEDQPQPALDRDILLNMAPQVEKPFIAVPKVLEDGGS